VTSLHCHAVNSLLGSSKPHKRIRSLRAAETSPTESSEGRKGILPFWGHKKKRTRGRTDGPLDDGHSPRHTAQFFVAKSYNLSHNAVSYDRGVLEDTMLNLEVFITKVFENLRIILRSVLLLSRKPVKQPEAARLHMRRASFQDMVQIFELLLPCMLEINMLQCVVPQEILQNSQYISSHDVSISCRVNWEVQSVSGHPWRRWKACSGQGVRVPWATYPGRRLLNALEMCPSLT
jgi:hypothetical protein